MTKSYRIVRQSPTDLDDSGDIAPSLEFDYTHAGGATPWPDRHANIRFGPALIRKAWTSGLIVLAEIDSFPNPVAVKEAQWTAGVLEVKTLDGPRCPRRLFTRRSVQGLKSTGEYVEPVVD